MGLYKLLLIKSRVRKYHTIGNIGVARLNKKKAAIKQPWIIHHHTL